MTSRARLAVLWLGVVVLGLISRETYAACYASCYQTYYPYGCCGWTVCNDWCGQQCIAREPQQRQFPTRSWGAGEGKNFTLAVRGNEIYAIDGDNGQLWKFEKGQWHKEGKRILDTQ